MNKHILPILILFLSDLAIAAPKVEIAGVQVVWNSYEDSFEFGGVLNSRSPVVVALVASVEDQEILGLSDDECEVTALKDGAGNDLKGKL